MQLEQKIEDIVCGPVLRILLKGSPLLILITLLNKYAWPVVPVNAFEIRFI